jgi:chloride channel protein 2
LFRTNFNSDIPFDLQELVVFALIGVVCGLAGAGYVALHQQIVRFNRTHKRLNRFLQSK